jgi:cell division protein FtsB
MLLFVVNRKKTSWKTIFYSNWFLFSNAIILVLILYASARNFYYDYQVRKEINGFKEQAKALELKNLKTIELLQQVKSQHFVEDKARVELNMVKPGEKLVIINGQKQATSTDGQDQVNMVEQERLTNPEKWWKYFFE